MEARIRKMADISLKDDSPPSEKDMAKSPSSNGPAERDFLEDDSPPLLDNQLGGINRKRAKRNLYSELYGGGTNVRDEANNLTSSTASTTTTMATSKNSHIHSPTTIVPIHFDGNPRNFHLTLGNVNVNGENNQRNNVKNGLGANSVIWAGNIISNLL